MGNGGFGGSAVILSVMADPYLQLDCTVDLLE
jgi:hypothetical protein